MSSLTGRHFIAGKWIDSATTFQADNPTTGGKNPTQFYNADPDLVDLACQAAAAAAASYAATSLEDRATFLRTIAEELDALGDELTEVGQAETALPAARLQGERGRTVNQLRFFADWIEEGSWLGARIDTANPDRAPLPKPDIRVCNKALGPVAVFGASNFPLAFSTAGGDTASALAAGCPVIVKAHAAHPGTAELAARAIASAAEQCGMPAGVFSLLQGGNRQVGTSLVAHPAIKAVGFTGSLGGGRALYDIAVSRPEPIPFYGELGSNNPVFMLPNRLEGESDQLAEAWVGSLTLGVGQFCTNPGIIILRKGDAANTFVATARSALEKISAQAMLTDRIAVAYRAGTQQLAAHEQVETLFLPEMPAASMYALPALYRVSAQNWIADPSLSDEVFGPAALIVECETDAEFVAIARELPGQLTATLQLTEADADLARDLTALLSEKAGRLLTNGFPTGVEVCHSMVHGGPYPASTDSRSTSVGSLAITRFVRPVSYQDFPDALLPEILKNANPLGLTRLLNGVYSTDSLS